MQNIKLYFLFLILFLFQNKIQAQVTFSKKVIFPSSIEDQYGTQKLYNANDGGYWLMASATESKKLKTGGQIAHFAADGTLIESKQVLPDTSGAIFIIDFVEMPNGNRAFVFSKDIKPAPNSFFPETFLQIFDSQWNQIGSRILYTENKFSFSGQYLLQVDDSNNLYLYFSEGGAAKLCKFNFQLNLTWCKYIDIKYPAVCTKMIVKPQSKGTILLFDEMQSETEIINVDENGNDSGSKKIKNFAALDVDFLSNGNLLLTGSASVSVPNSGSNFKQRAWVELTPTYNIVSTRFFNFTLFPITQTVAKSNGGFVCYFRDFINADASYYQFDNQRKLINNKSYSENYNSGNFTINSNVVILPNGNLVSAYKIASINEVRLRQLSANLEVPSCSGKKSCTEEGTFTVTIENRAFLPILAPLPKNTQITTTWKDNPLQIKDECFETIEKREIVVKDTICIGASVQPILIAKQTTNIKWTFENGSPSTSNLLDPGEIMFNSPGKFKIQAILKISDCISDTLTKFITVFQKPQNTLPKDTLLCNQSIFLLKANVQNLTNWKWEDNQTNENPRPLTADGKYTINATIGECKVNESISVKFREANALFSLADTLCEETKITLISSQKDNSKNNWQILPATFPPLAEANPIPFLLPKGIYTITHEVNNDGCKAQISKKIMVTEAPKVDLGTDIVELGLGKTITLNPKITPPNAKLFWENGSNTATRLINEKGIYSITVNLFACSATDKIEIVEKPSIFAPTIFAPNGTNTIFEIFTNEALEPISLEIYDKWGNFLLKTENMQWDATYRNLLVPAGVYVYIARFRKKIDNTIVLKSGDVMVVY